MSATVWHASIFEWLAGLFMAPVPEAAVASYRDGLGASLLDAIGEEAGCDAGVLRMRSALIADASAAATARSLAVSFTVLFDGVGGPRTVSPYESAYVGATRRLFGAPTADMDRLLRHHDVATGDAVHEPPDHLSIELALLARLMRENADNDAQSALLDDHLLVWVPTFAERCCDADGTGFYAGAVRVLTAFLAGRREILQVRTGVTPCRSN